MTRPELIRPDGFMSAAERVLAGAPARRGWRGPKLDAPTQEALAAAVGAARRGLRVSPYPAQVAAAMGLLEGHAVEMKTGEGKTLSAFLAAATLAQKGRHVMVLTANDYLCERDSNTLRDAFGELGLEVGLVLPGMTLEQKRAHYARDVVYLSFKEAVFDWMRDGLRRLPWRECQTRRDVALIDELDAALLDEALVPFSIGRLGQEAAPRGVVRIDRVVADLVPGRDYQREGSHAAHLTDEGWTRVESALRDAGLLDAEEELFGDGGSELVHTLTHALHAHAVLERDRHYMVREGELALLDPVSGRVAAGRRWGEGLQQAVECKERLALSVHPSTRARTSAGAYLKQFHTRAGLSGTLRDCAEELHELHGMRTLALPTHRPLARVDHADRAFDTPQARDAALLDALRESHSLERPVLVGTWSIPEAKHLSRQLSRAGLRHATLTAHDEPAEARIIAEAGAPGQITIATQLAGRGTDIRLGGSGADLDPRLRERIHSAGGLRVWLYGRASSRRHDEQLRGRCGRQGDPGETCAWIVRGAELERALGVDSMEHAQSRGESQRRQERRLRAELDAVLEVQRRAYVVMRERALWGVCPSHYEALEALDPSTRIPARHAWWAETLVDRIKALWRRRRKAQPNFRGPELLAELLMEYGVAVRWKRIATSARPVDLAARLVCVGLLERAEAAEVSVTAALAEAHRDLPAQTKGARDRAEELLQARMHASRPRHVLRYLRLHRLQAYDEAWCAFLTLTAELQERSVLERDPRSSPARALQAAAHAAFGQLFDEAERQVGRALLTTDKVTRDDVDHIATRWLRGAPLPDAGVPTR